MVAKDQDGTLSIGMKAMSRMFETMASNPTRRNKPPWIPVGSPNPPITLVVNDAGHCWVQRSWAMSSSLFIRDGIAEYALSQRVWHATGRSAGIGNEASDYGR